MKSEKQKGCLCISPATGKSNPCIPVAARVVGALSPSLEGQLLEASVGDSFTFPEASHLQDLFCSFKLHISKTFLLKAVYSL